MLRETWCLGSKFLQSKRCKALNRNRAMSLYSTFTHIDIWFFFLISQRLYLHFNHIAKKTSLPVCLPSLTKLFSVSWQHTTDNATIKTTLYHKKYEKSACALKKGINGYQILVQTQILLSLENLLVLALYFQYLLRNLQFTSHIFPEEVQVCP